MAVHVVQKKINWANKDGVVVIADQQQKKHPSILPTERKNNTEGEKKKRKSCQEAKEDVFVKKAQRKWAKCIQLFETKRATGTRVSTVK